MSVKQRSLYSCLVCLSQISPCLKQHITAKLSCNWLVDITSCWRFDATSVRFVPALRGPTHLFHHKSRESLAADRRSTHLRWWRSNRRRPISSAATSSGQSRTSQSERKSGTAPVDWSSPRRRPPDSATSTAPSPHRSAPLLPAAPPPPTTPTNHFRFHSTPVLGHRRK